MVGGLLAGEEVQLPPPAAAATAAKGSEAGGSVEAAVAPQDASGGSGGGAAAPRAAGSTLRGPDAFSAQAAAVAAAAASRVPATPSTLLQPAAVCRDCQAEDSVGAAAEEAGHVPADSGPNGGVAGAEAQGIQPDGGGAGRAARHYWGQALQHLDRGCGVEEGSRITLLAKRDGPAIRFSLRVRCRPAASRPCASTRPTGSSLTAARRLIWLRLALHMQGCGSKTGCCQSRDVCDLFAATRMSKWCLRSGSVVPLRVATGHGEDIT